MRLTEIKIDRFGVWRDLRVPLSESGISVFYGPNEAGKSTLMRFVRGVMYGFRPPTGIEQHSATARGDAKGPTSTRSDETARDVDESAA